MRSALPKALVYLFCGAWALLCFAGGLRAVPALAVLVTDTVALVFMLFALRGRVGLRGSENAHGLFAVALIAGLFLWLVPELGQLKAWFIFAIFLPLVPIGVGARLLVESLTTWLADTEKEEAWDQRMYLLLAGITMVIIPVSIASTIIDGEGFNGFIRALIVLSMGLGVLVLPLQVGWKMAALDAPAKPAEAKIAATDDLKKAGITRDL